MRTLLGLLVLSGLTACGSAFPDNASPSSSGNPEAVLGTDGPDNDGDGYGEDVDCDDTDANVNSSEQELVGNAVDDDCDGLIDCADPSAPLEEMCYDGDHDGWCDGSIGDSAVDTVFLCETNDANAQTVATQTGGDASKVANYIPVVYVSDGMMGWVLPEADCSDANADIYPAAPEICDGLVNDCDAAPDAVPDEGAEGSTNWYADVDVDGYGFGDATMSCVAPDGYVGNGDDCDDAVWAINPGAAEVCDDLNVDEDCSGLADDDDATTAPEGMLQWYSDMDGDTFTGTDAGMSCDGGDGLTPTDGGDCNEVDPAINPGAVEVCDGMDNDCNAATEDTVTWYHDADHDGYGGDLSATSCTQPSTYVANSDDCEDADADINPSAIEVTNGYDDNCDLLVDGDDPALVCLIEIDLRTDSTVTVSAINGWVSDDATLNGEWFAAGVPGVSVSATSDSLGELYIIEFDHCLDASSVITLDPVYTNGDHGCHLDMSDAPGVAEGWEDFTGLNVSNGTTNLGGSSSGFCGIDVTE